MEPPPFELTPAQKGLLESLSRETGKPVPALIAEALERLQEHVHPHHANDQTNARDELAAMPPHEAPKPIWELFEAASRAIPDEELERIPIDLAAQVDHYVYGLPKRPA